MDLYEAIARRRDSRAELRPDQRRRHVLGRHAIADTGLRSVCLAIEDLWHRCTAEGLGVGWVSSYREAFLSELVDIPHHVRPVAWLCVGEVGDLPDGWIRGSGLLA